MSATKRLFEEQRERERHESPFEDADYLYLQFINQYQIKPKMEQIEKEAILRTLHDLNENLINGHVDPLKAYIALREINDLTQDLMKTYRDQAVAEVTKHGGKYEQDNWTISVQKSAGRWDFKAIPEWVRQHEALKVIEEAGKESYKIFLKGNNMVTSDGEIVTRAQFTEGSETLIFKQKPNKSNQ